MDNNIPHDKSYIIPYAYNTNGKLLFTSIVEGG